MKTNRLCKGCGYKECTAAGVDGAAYCDRFIPKTNADHVRNMTNEELADCLTDNPFQRASWLTETGRTIVHERISDWLKQPYDGGERR